MAPESRSPSGWGSLSGGLGVGIVIAATALGGIVTLVTRTQPGRVLGGFVIAGTVVAALAVRPRAARLIVPAPVLCYLVAALATGIIADRSTDSSKAALAIGAAQWVANGFFAMALATIAALALVVIRWYLGRGGRSAPDPSARPARWDGSPPGPRAARGESGYPGNRTEVLDPARWDETGPLGRDGGRGLQGYAELDQRPGRYPDPRGDTPREPPRGTPRADPYRDPRLDGRTGQRPGPGPYNFSSGA
jgi:hypothetical protein